MLKNHIVKITRNSPQDDEAIGRMCAWLKKNGMVGQTTLAGKLTLTPKDEAYTHLLFGEVKNE